MKRFSWMASLLTLQVFALEDENQSKLLGYELRLNGKSTQRAFAEAKEEALRTTVRLERNGKLIALGLLVDPSGLVLTKASSCIGAREASLANGERYALRIRKRDEPTDLALYQLIGEGDEFPAVRWSNLSNLENGSWVLSAFHELQEIRVGVASGKTRPIEREGGVMGVILGSSSKSPQGITIREVVPQAAADKAGLLSGDLITKVDGRRVKTSNHVVDLVNDKDPGDVVVLSILRKGDDRDFRITLGHRSVTFDLFNRNMQMSGPVSKRKDNFPLVFQHDLPLEREAMGGPVFDLNGKCLGINIARVDRVTVFSLPSKIVRERLEDFLSELDAR